MTLDALDAKGAPMGFDAVAEPAETRPAGRGGSTDPVVADRHDHGAVG
jgi:hypothetical protein